MAVEVNPDCNKGQGAGCEMPAAFGPFCVTESNHVADA
jgi:hypothetical protein